MGRELAQYGVPNHPSWASAMRWGYKWLFLLGLSLKFYKYGYTLIQYLVLRVSPALLPMQGYT